MNINFDQNWNYCQRRATTNDDDFNAINNSYWSPVDLPHIIVIERKQNINNNRHRWWYRKQFQLISTDQPLKQSILLTFKSSDHPTGNITDSIIVWLDTVKLFSNSITNSPISIELPSKLFNSDPIKTDHQTHTLTVCCVNGCLPLNAFLTVPLNTTCIIREVSCTATVQNDHGISNNGTLVNGEILKNTIDEERIQTTNHLSVPYLTIVMLIVGTRGDVQPFIAFGKALRAAGHRVRLATHEKFRRFVRQHGLEFYPLSSDPSEIMSFMVENNGIIPSITGVFQNGLLQKRRVFFDILYSTWLACTSNDDETGAPFQAETIIANPLSYGHIHCAEKLGIPLHMAFTMPYSPTAAFAHPLSSISYSQIPNERLNIFSYSLVETVMWAGIGDLINEFRQDVLDLPILHIAQGASLMIDEKVPFIYCWSPSLVPKPLDWPSYIDISGYFCLNLGKDYVESNSDLLRFLGLSSKSTSQTTELSPPIFIGFGSITGHDSQQLLKLVLDALMQTGYRAILSGFDVNAMDLPESVFIIDDIPYDWLFQHVSAVCHHAGAGTTAAGLLAGKPTITVPFFGDQFFWAHIVEKSGVGPPALPGKQLTVEKLVEAFKFVHRPDVQQAAKRVQESIAYEDGCERAIRAFHTNLPLSAMRSDLESTFPACFRLDEFNLQVSRPVAQVLLSCGVVDESQFRYHFTKQWRSEQNPTSEMSTSNLPTTIDFQLYTTNNKPFAYYGFRNDTSTLVNRSHDDNHQSSLIISNDSTVPLTTTETTVVTNLNGLEQHNSHDISMMLRNAANMSGYSLEVCRDILLKFIRIKRQHQQTRSFLSTNPHQSSIATIRRSQLYSDLIALSVVVLDVVFRFSAVLLDMSVYNKTPAPSDRYTILSWLLSRWLKY